uniref:C2 domain-containing protein n=1 Tax=Solanum lycopersicum TaxID=4081 RepID=A0A3Q7I9G7_SOLLC
MGILKPFQLLEINIISAQDLEPVSKKMKTYATVWVHPTRKLTTAVDIEGGNNPTWNDKFVFRVDEEFLRQDTSAVQIEIHCGHWFKDSLVGSVRVLVGNLIPSPSRTHHNHHPHNLGMRFVALQVRRPSGRPQGILNIGVALLDSTMRSMPLYTELNKSASERSERVKFDDDVPKSSGSIVAKPSKKKNKAHNYDKESSILSISLEPPPQMLVKKKGKASSMVSGPKEEKPKDKKGKTGSVLSDSIVSKESSLYNIGPKEDKPKLKLIALELENKEKPTNEKKVDEKSLTKPKVEEKSLTKPKVDEPKEPITVIGKPIQNYNGYEFGGPKGVGHNGKFVFGGPIKGNAHHWTDSEIGPSASEVAAAVAEKKYPLDDQKSSMLDGWSLDESVEGLRSKLERWRTEVPPVYDRGQASSSYRSTGRHARRHARGSSGLFSCFGNIMGFECQCICGKPQKKYNTRFYSPSVGSRSFF